MSWLAWFVSFGIFLLTAVGLWVTRTRAPKRIWKCVRHSGGGTLCTPRQMTEERAVTWIAQNHGEVIYIDVDNGFIFYRPTK